jgi:hypothetical protein
MRRDTEAGTRGQRLVGFQGGRTESALQHDEAMVGDGDDAAGLARWRDWRICKSSQSGTSARAGFSHLSMGGPVAFVP